MAGHSRLVIGVEEHSGKDGGLYLLLFDPSHSAKQMQGLVEDIQSSSSGLRHLRRSLKQMRCKQYQIVYVDGIMEPTEMEQGKILDSLRVPWHSSTSYAAITVNATKKTPQRKSLTAKTQKLWSFCNQCLEASARELPLCETALRRKEKMGTFRKAEGNGSEDVTSKHKFTLFVTQRNLFKAFVI